MERDQELGADGADDDTGDPDVSEFIDLSEGTHQFALAVQPFGAPMQSFFEVRGEDINEVLSAVITAIVDEAPVLCRRTEDAIALLTGIPRSAIVQVVEWSQWQKQMEAAQQQQQAAAAQARFGLPVPTKIVRRGQG
jgi:hypothetical protein